MAIDLYN